jgi:hypothetical protein
VVLARQAIVGKGKKRVWLNNEVKTKKRKKEVRKGLQDMSSTLGYVLRREREKERERKKERERERKRGRKREKCGEKQ